MRFYLRVINPIIALLTFILCFWAATATDDEFNIFGIVIGGMNTYFFAKGLFTSCSLFIIGRILLEMFYHTDKNIDRKYKNKEKIFTVSFLVFTVGSLIGLYMLSDSDLFEKETNTQTEQNPKEISISHIHRVTESDDLKYSFQLINQSSIDWNKIELTCKLFIDGNYSENVFRKIEGFNKDEKKDVLIEFKDFRNSKVPETSGIKFDIEGTKAIEE